MFYLIAYDITSDKRRKKLSDILEKYGTRVNYSVFEVEINETKLEHLVYEIELQKLINKKYDSLRFYHICKNCTPKCFELSNSSDPFTPKEFFI